MAFDSIVTSLFETWRGDGSLDAERCRNGMAVWSVFQKDKFKTCRYLLWTELNLKRLPMLAMTPGNPNQRLSRDDFLTSGTFTRLE